ncbi:PAAR domain-containing protein [Vibrio parahaemolyticus]
MAKTFRFAAIGDKTTTGGVLTEGGVTTFVNGLPIAFVGKVYCPKCNVMGAIIQRPHHTVNVEYHKAAVEHDDIVCGCLTGTNKVAIVGMRTGYTILDSGQTDVPLGQIETEDPLLQFASEISAQMRKAQSEPLSYGGIQAIESRLSDSLALKCSLEEELAKNHQQVLITDLEDAHKILHNIWLEMGKDTAMIAASINTAKSWFNHTEPMFDAASIAKQFGDMNIKAELVESKGKAFVAFNGIDKNGKALKYAFVNGTRINMAGKKYPLNSFKSMQAGFSPKSRAVNFKGAALLTFVVSASIATTDLVFKDDYHLVNWFGNVGADMFKALLQYGAGEAALLAAAYFSAPIVLGGVAVFAVYAAIEIAWGEFGISQKIVTELENAIEN